MLPIIQLFMGTGRSGLIILSVFWLVGMLVSVGGWEIKTLSGYSYNSPPIFAISLEDHSAAFLSSAYCVHDSTSSSAQISYSRDLCKCSTCIWKNRKGLSTEDEWQSAVQAEMSRLVGAPLRTSPSVDNTPNKEEELIGSWIAEIPLSMTVTDSFVDDLVTRLGGEISISKAMVVSENGDRVFFVVSGTPSSTHSLLSNGFKTITPIPPILKVDPFLEESSNCSRSMSTDVPVTSQNAGSSLFTESSSSWDNDQNSGFGTFHSLHVQLRERHSRPYPPYNATATNATMSTHGPVQRLSTAWSGVISDQLGHDNVEVMADGDRHVTVQGLSRSETYKVALEIAKHGDVKWIAPRGRLVSSNFFASQLVQSGTWYMPDTWGAQVPDEYIPPLSSLGLTGKGHVVGVADTGLDWTSCFFKDDKVRPKFKWNEKTRIAKRKKSKFEVWKSKKHRKIRQYVAYMNGKEDEDNGHGTHVCGSVAGFDVGGIDVISQDYGGVAPDAKLAFFDIYSSTEENGHHIPSDVGKHVFPYAYKVGARVYVASYNYEPYGGRTRGGGGYSSMAQSLDAYCCYKQKDFTVFVSAGNLVNGAGKIARDHFSSISEPAEAKNAVTVGSHFNPRRLQDGPPPAENNVASVVELSKTSARGPTHDLRIKPDVCGPGSQVMSAGTSERPGVENCYAVYKDGTSSANAIVAGVAVLIRQYFMEGYYPTGEKGASTGFTPHAALIKAILINSGQALWAPNEKGEMMEEKVPSRTQGWGRVNLASTLIMPSSSPSGLKLTVRARLYVKEGDVLRFDVKVSRETYGLPLKITLVWTDPPAETGSRRVLVNDLDLTAERLGSSGEVFLGNGKKRKADRRNNVEHITIPTPTAGSTYTIRVSGHRVAYGDAQVAALVISGPQRYI